MSTYQIDRAKEREYAEQNNWILFPNEFPSTNYAAEQMLDIDIQLRRPPVFIELDKEFWDRHFNAFTTTELKEKCDALGLFYKPKAAKQALVVTLTYYFRTSIGADRV